MPLHPRQTNPLDDYRNSLVEAMQGISGSIHQMASRVPPYDSRRVQDKQRELLIYDNPHVRFLGQTNPETGQPFTNAEAAAYLHQNGVPGYEQAGGPVSQYVAYTEEMEALRAKLNAGEEATSG